MSEHPGTVPRQAYWDGLRDRIRRRIFFTRELSAKRIRVFWFDLATSFTFKRANIGYWSRVWVFKAVRHPFSSSKGARPRGERRNKEAGAAETACSFRALKTTQSAKAWCWGRALRRRCMLTCLSSRGACTWAVSRWAAKRCPQGARFLCRCTSG